MVRYITIEELKNDGFINANIENEYLYSAIDESQLIYLKELLGDKLYSAMDDKVEHETLDGKYLILMNEYIKPYLKYKVLSVLCVPLTFKLRNAGVVSQFSNEISTTNVNDTKYIESFYNQKADFFANRLTKYLVLNKKDIKEYKYCCKEVTNPNDIHTICGIYLGN